LLQRRPTDGGLAAVLEGAALASAVGGTEELVARALEAVGVGASPTAPVGDAVLGRPLRALTAALLLAAPRAPVRGAVRRLRALGDVPAPSHQAKRHVDALSIRPTIRGNLALLPGPRPVGRIHVQDLEELRATVPETASRLLALLLS
jgi:hypothetical protein